MSAFPQTSRCTCPKIGPNKKTNKQTKKYQQPQLNWKCSQLINCIPMEANPLPDALSVWPPVLDTACFSTLVFVPILFTLKWELQALG